MNDFTKEELESIKNAMGCLNINKILKGKVPTDVELINKIQSMIDNYKTDCPEIRDINCIYACPKCGEHHEG